MQIAWINMSIELSSDLKFFFMWKDSEEVTDSHSLDLNPLLFLVSFCRPCMDIPPHSRHSLNTITANKAKSLRKIKHTVTKAGQKTCPDRDRMT